MVKPKPLAERAAAARKIAAEHRTLAAETLRIAEDLEAKATLMEQGIDPYAERDEEIGTGQSTRSSTAFERPEGNIYDIDDDGGSSLTDVSDRPTIIAPVTEIEDSPTEKAAAIARLDELIEEARADRDRSVGAEEYERHHNRVAALRAERKTLMSSAASAGETP